MKTITLTDAEYELVKRAVEAYNDYQADTVLELHIDAVDLFPSEVAIQTLDRTKAVRLRTEISNVIDACITMRNVTDKFGIKIGDNGYCTGK